MNENQKIGCIRCKCVILKAGVANKCKNSGPMLGSIKKEQDAQPEYYWKVDNMMKFENIGFCNTIDNIKFLSCADCDLAPLGYHDIRDTTAYYIATDRVQVLL
jgi:hypothetical protein